MNEYVNLYNQKQKDKSKRLPKFKILYKQILSDRESTSSVTEKFGTSEEVLETINSFLPSWINQFSSTRKRRN
ncbi:hypothetical protein [Elizabethkingia sp. JS20170427COW]|uniref:hypothetical protein n=1 Tax=Elizabethkingia sp. JS20170427COW TaxID=2583851 RepID=UPI001110A249|nr:hypothetical protein [Elizabethkingia sp. JS20170427COW]QCX53982.1 hypothetical protein FGE20_09680 [Elizabethkingia sp. JS20170427COW]